MYDSGQDNVVSIKKNILLGANLSTNDRAGLRTHTSLDLLHWELLNFSQAYLRMYMRMYVLRVIIMTSTVGTYCCVGAASCTVCNGGGCVTLGGALAVGCATAVLSRGAGTGWLLAPLKGPTLKQMEKPLTSLQCRGTTNWDKATRHTCTHKQSIYRIIYHRTFCDQ